MYINGNSHENSFFGGDVPSCYCNVSCSEDFGPLQDKSYVNPTTKTDLGANRTIAIGVLNKISKLIDTTDQLTVSDLKEYITKLKTLYA